MTAAALAGRIRPATGWWPGTRTGARVVTIRCPHCRIWRRPGQFRRVGGNCRKCAGTG